MRRVGYAAVAAGLLALAAGLASSSRQSTSPANVLLAAGDIASCASGGDQQTAELIRRYPRATVATLGDNAYPSGSAKDFARCYAPSWGEFKRRTRPAAGNHEYQTPDAAAYFSYFGRAAGRPGSGWYSYDLAGWHVVVLNSNCERVGGCDARSPQVRWLRRDLARRRARCTLAYWHAPRFSSGARHGGAAALEPFWRALFDARADVVLAGHEHNYERFAPQTPDGKRSPRGIRQFVAGTGGAPAYPFARPAANSVARVTGKPGVLALTLRRRGYGWRFITAPEGETADAGSAACVR